MPDSITLFPCAKVNLSLDVFEKRNDGYHDLASIFQSIGLHDELQLERVGTPGVTFHCDTEGVLCDASNLVVKAANALLLAANSQAGVAIKLIKTIPTQAGLGGGSSDAASTLVGMNRLLDLGFASDELHQIGVTIGSDVPFFLIGGTAMASGRGEVLTELPDGPVFPIVVVKPNVGVPTSWAYSELDNHPERMRHLLTMKLLDSIQSGDREGYLHWQGNDFEEPVFTKFQEIAWAADEMRMLGLKVAHLCGSGAAVYGVATSQQEAESVAAKFEERYPFVAVTKTLRRNEAQKLALGYPA